MAKHLTSYTIHGILYNVMVVQQIENATLRERAYKVLKDSILRNELLPGEVLSIDSLAKDLGISQTPVREALTKLSSDGLVEYERNKGFRVASITEDDVHETYEVRRLLEPYAASLVAKKVSTDPSLERRLHELRKTAETIQKLATSGKVLNPSQYEIYMGIDLRLHEIMLEAVGESLLGSILDLVGNHSLRIRSFAEIAIGSSRGKLLQDINREHLAIIKALIDQDGERAQETVKVHLDNAEKRTVDAVRKNRMVRCLRGATYDGT